MKLRSLFYTFCLLFSGVCLMGLPAHADEDVVEEQAEVDEDTPRKKKGKKKKGSKKSKSSKKNDADKAAEDAENAADDVPAVVAALKKFKVHNGKVNEKAEFYIYLYSASWCRYCKECMPVAVKHYPKMRASRKVELIVIGGDKSEKEAIKYLKSYKLKSPGIMFDALKATQFLGLPGCGMPGFPAVCVVTKDGQMVKNEVGGAAVQDVLNNWKTHTVGK